MKDLFDDIRNGALDISGLNYEIITLVLKTKYVNQIQKSRQICLLNVSFSFLTKVLTNRLNRVLGDVNSSIQNDFVKGRYIMVGF